MCIRDRAGHESFAAAEGAIGIAEKANKVRQKPLRVILNLSLIHIFFYPPAEYQTVKLVVAAGGEKLYTSAKQLKVPSVFAAFRSFAVFGTPAISKNPGAFNAFAPAKSFSSPTATTSFTV